MAMLRSDRNNKFLLSGRAHDEDGGWVGVEGIEIGQRLERRKVRRQSWLGWEKGAVCVGYG